MGSGTSTPSPVASIQIPPPVTNIPPPSPDDDLSTIIKMVLEEAPLFPMNINAPLSTSNSTTTTKRKTQDQYTVEYFAPPSLIDTSSKPAVLRRLLTPCTLTIMFVTLCYICGSSLQRSVSVGLMRRIITTLYNQRVMRATNSTGYLKLAEIPAVKIHQLSTRQILSIFATCSRIVGKQIPVSQYRHGEHIKAKSALTMMYIET